MYSYSEDYDPSAHDNEYIAAFLPTSEPCALSSTVKRSRGLSFLFRSFLPNLGAVFASRNYLFKIIIPSDEKSVPAQYSM